MSIINQMLLDLDKRRASSAERGALPNQARALPPRAAPPRGLLWGGVIVAAAVLIAAIAWQVRQFSARNLPSLTVAPTAEVAPQPRMALELATPSATPAEKKAAARHDKIAAAPVPPVTPEPAAKPKPKPAATSPAPIAAVAPEASDTDVKTITLGEKPSAPAADQLSKQIHEMTPEQLAENDYRRAVELMNQGHLSDAQSALEAALQLNPAHAGAREGLFGLLLAAKKNDEAERVLQDGLALNPNQAGFAMALARLQAERGDTAAAITTMQNSEAAAQSNADYQALFAALLQRAGRNAEAVDHYQAALKLAPQSGVWWMGLGISLQKLERKAEARDAFARAKASGSLTPELQAFVDQRLQQLQ